MHLNFPSLAVLAVMVAVLPMPCSAQTAPETLLTKSEKDMNCKRMAGTMRVRILELRGGGAKQKGSGLAQGLHGVTAPIFGGTTRGADTAGDAANDVAKLKAMNDTLIAKSCPHYDLEAELAKDHSAPTPKLIYDKGGRKLKAEKKGGKTDLKAKVEAWTSKIDKATKP